MVAASDSAVSTGRARRAMRPAALLARGGARWLAASALPGRRERRERAMLRTSEDVARTLGEMKGAVMKLGQVMSLMTGVVPPEMRGELATLQSNARPMAWPLVEQALTAEYGERPGQLFRRFEREPFAAASIGQVHRATLPDGRKVAVKVQYPGIQQAVAADLANIGLLFGAAGRMNTGLDVPAVWAELRDGILGELDYRREAQAQARMAALFADHPFIRVPGVVRELSTDTVLVQDYLEGEHFAAALNRPQAERNRIAEIVYRFSFGSIYRHGLFQGDPHPGNYLLSSQTAVWGSSTSAASRASSRRR